MTSVSANASSAYPSPLDRLKSELTKQVSAGTVSAADETSLSSALDDIDSSLAADRATDKTARHDPADVGTKVTQLISQQVSSGQLTAEQGKDLQSVFDAASTGGDKTRGPGGPHGGGGPRGAGGPPPSDDNTGSTSSTTSTSDVSDLLSTFLKQLQSQQDTTGYTASGKTSRQTSSLLVDYEA